MANIKHAAIDLSIAIAVAAALGWSASLPGRQVESLEVNRTADVEHALTTTAENLALTENLATEAMVTGAMPANSGQNKGTAVRYCKSPLSGKPQLSTLKS